MKLAFLRGNKFSLFCVDAVSRVGEFSLMGLSTFENLFLGFLIKMGCLLENLEFLEDSIGSRTFLEYLLVWTKIGCCFLNMFAS